MGSRTWQKAVLLFLLLVVSGYPEASTRITALQPSTAGPVPSGPAAAEVEREPVTVPPVFARFLRTATEFRLYSVVSQFDARFAAMKGARTIAGYPILGETRVSRKTAREMAAIVTDPRSYLPEGEGWSCIPEAEYVMRFRKGEATLDVVLASCTDVEIIPTGIAGAERWSQGLQPSKGSCRLCALMCETLPRAQGQHL